MSAVQIGKILRNEGFSVSQRKINNNSSTVILNLNFNKKKEEKPLKPLEPSISYINPYREVIYNLDGLSGSSGSQREKDDNWSKEDLEKLRNATNNKI